MVRVACIIADTAGLVETRITSGAIRDQFLGPAADAFGVFACEPVINPNVTANGPAKFLEAPPEGREVGLPDLIVLGEPHEHADPRHLPRRLRPGGERPGEERASQSAKECAPVHHSIT
jgi:hypothetical protein